MRSLNSTNWTKDQETTARLYQFIKRKDNHIVVLRSFISSLVLALLASTAFSQTGNTVEYISADDKELTINRIVIANVIDNVNNVYSNPLTEWLNKRIENDHQWNAVSYNRKLDSDYLEAREVQKILSESNAEGLITSRVLRGPQGLSYRMTFYVGKQGLPLVQEYRQLPTSDSLDDVQRNFENLYEVILSRLPYDGVILSRKGNDVTISIGKNYRIKSGSQIDVIQILKVQRHPKHQFMVASEKSIIGKIVITKADDALSFGRISFEKEANVIRPGNKIISQRMVHYPTQEEMLKDPSFGESPTEWVEQSNPQFGKFIVWAGIGQYRQTAELVTEGGIDADSPFSPTIKLEGEIWLNQDWYLGLGTMQSALTLSNPIAGDSPSNLSTTLSSYTVSAGYNWLLGSDFLGPKIQTSIGLHQFTSDPASSTPTLAFTRMQFGGMYLGFNGSMNPVQGSPWDIGAQFKFFVTKTVSESPKSGSASNTNILDFSLYTRYRKTSRMSYMGQLAFENYSSDFSGTGSRPDPATEISHKNTLILLGIEYAF